MNRNINTEGICIQNNCIYSYIHEYIYSYIYEYMIYITSYISRRLRIKMRYYFTSFRLVKIQTIEIPNAGENMEQLEFSFIASVNAK